VNTPLPVYVVAKDYRDFQLWCDDHGFRPTDHAKVRPLLEADRVRGHTFFREQVIVTERGWDNRQAAEILRTVEFATRITRAEAVERLRTKAFARSCGIDHAHECCFAHETHSTPHLGCPVERHG
jgi:hypothetical protein